MIPGDSGVAAPLVRGPDAGNRGVIMIRSELVEMLATGTIKPTIGALLPLTEIVQAHELFEQGKTLGKIVLHP